MRERAERHHWLNTYVGLLDGAFRLSDEELFAVTDILRKLLILLDVPGRATPTVMPVPVAHEVEAGYYTQLLEARTRTRTIGAQVRPTDTGDATVSLEAWREALTTMLTSTYPGIRPEEQLTLTKVFGDLLANIGVPRRAAAYHPQVVINAHNALGLDA